MTDVPGTITSISALVTAAGAVVIAWRRTNGVKAAKTAAEAAQTAAEESKREIVATKDGVFELGKRLDGRLQELLRVSNSLARAEGLIEGRAAERAEPDKPKTEPKQGGK